MNNRARKAARAAARALAFAAPLGAACWTSAKLRPPRPDRRDAAAGAGAFSAAGAEQHLRTIAGGPRPSGSEAAAETRAYLVEQLTACGFEVDVQTSVGVGTSTPTPYGPRYLGAGRVHNVLARRHGTERGRALALMTHYDSVAQGPGAGDAGAPVAALLEAARALGEREPLRNDLLVVFTDGEECGLLGARAFFAEHPWAADVRVVLNFEARGTSGPVLMFETGPGNGPLIKELGRSGVPVFASSLFYEVYRRLPNATDFALAKARSLPGLNFANIGGFVNYHSPLDDLDRLDRNTLWHHGRLALEVGERLGRGDLTELRGDDATFFTVGEGRLVRYSTRVSRILAGAATGLYVLGRCRAGGGRAAVREAGVGAATAAACLVCGGAVATAAVQAVGRRSPEFRRGGDLYDSDRVRWALAGLAAAGTLSAPGSPESRRLGAETLLTGANAWLTVALPGAGYLTTWPLLGSCLGAVLLRGRSPVVRAWGSAVGALPAAVVLAPLGRLLYQGLTPRAAATAVVAWQFLGELAVPALDGMPRGIRRGLALALTGAGVGTLLHRAAGGPPDDARPAPETLSYLTDADSGQSWWLSSDPEPNAWTGRALGTAPERGERPEWFPGWAREFLAAPGPADTMAAPVVDVLSESATDGRRRLRLRVRSPRGARQISLSVPGGDVARWSVEGRAMTRGEAEIGEPGTVWELWLHAVDPEGFVVELDLPSSPVPLRVLDRGDGLPEELRKQLLQDGPEPAGRVQAAALDVESWGNATFSSRWVRL
ncbi:M20/M25/M40 family metallo-hydrolase [Streptomyces yerevanensis]|uniref:M20/M25/M40 family metallo-hydrolase n=1 Tax=Streptomyces yerevanensis TaxID=66378 RepID=UPI000526F982|nr:M20/M25/M40 family metallo-hydrolase [Streptomyces yerevanensis]